jgi:endonuclease/exonuclease/phosphatase (EEP) superfamily protein YafD
MVTGKREREAAEERESQSTDASVSWFLTRMLVIALCASTVLTLFARTHWLADLLANLRMQQLIALTAALVMCVMHRRWMGLAVVVLLVAMHLPWFGSTLRRSNRREIDEHSRLTVTLANVLTGNRRHADVAADLTSRDPDIIVVLELGSALAVKLSAEISQVYPYAVVRPQDQGNFGIGLFSKYPLAEEDVFTLNLGIESIAATVKIVDQEYRIYATHPLPPIGARGFSARNAHLSRLAQRTKRFQKQSPATAVVLVGDLNLTPWSPHFTDLERASGLVRASRRFDVTPTWYRFQSFPFGLILDHGLISKHLQCISYTVGPDIGSDHRSITLTLAQTEG